MSNNPILAERYPARVAAAFEDAGAARRAAEELLYETGLTRDQVRIVDPHDPSVASKIETENQGIWQTVMRTHLLFGGLGLFAGLAVAATSLSAGLAFVLSQPVMVIVTSAVFGAVAGLLIGGLVSTRPDHVRLYRLACEAARAKNWLVVALASDRAERDRARETLARRTSELAGAR